MFESNYLIINCSFSGRNYHFRNFHCYFLRYVNYETICFFNTPFYNDVKCLFIVNEYRSFDRNLIIPLSIKDIGKFNITLYFKAKSDLSIYCYFIPNAKFLVNHIDLSVPFRYVLNQKCFFESGNISQYVCNFAITKSINLLCYFNLAEKSNIITNLGKFGIIYNHNINAFVSVGNFIQFLSNYCIEVKENINCYFNTSLISNVNNLFIRLPLSDLFFNTKIIFSSVPLFYEIRCIFNDISSYNIKCFFNYSKIKNYDLRCYFITKQVNIINLYDLYKAKLRFNDYECYTESFVYNYSIKCFYEIREEYYKVNAIRRSETLKPEVELMGYGLTEGDLEIIHNKYVNNVIYDKGKVKLSLTDTGLYSFQMFTKYGTVVSNTRKKKRIIVKIDGEFEVSY